MSRITSTSRHAGPITRWTLSFARRKAARMTGMQTPGMIEPLEAFAHAPRLLFGYGALELASERTNRVEHRLKELAVLKAATIVDCEYCIDIGSSMARRAGLSDEQLLALPRHRSSELFSEREKLVLDLAAAMTRTPVGVPDELFESLRGQFDDDQLVELVGVVALENFRARFNSALDIGSAGFSQGMVCALSETGEGGAEAVLADALDADAVAAAGAGGGSPGGFAEARSSRAA
ncbi:MAG TPA: carboxymuconolactone decarboxylase family protein [Solirubrobacteraceae bacterium]|nr:carboxymuconolactone decarboxylase family protein [Solirubrobacteraceae bacterium]